MDIQSVAWGIAVNRIIPPPKGGDPIVREIAIKKYADDLLSEQDRIIADFNAVIDALEGFVLVSEEQAKDTERLNFLLSDSRYVRTVVERDIQNDDYEVTGKHFLFTELYWIDGWDYHENTSSGTARGALDKAMIEAQEQKE